MSVSEEQHSVFVLFFLPLSAATAGPRVESSAVATGLICYKINMLKIPEFMDRQMAMDNTLIEKQDTSVRAFGKFLVKPTISSTECATGNKGE